MAATTIHVSVDVPATYHLDELTKQLTEYAKKLVATVKTSKTEKHHYRHEALKGIFTSDASERDLVEDYLKEKYQL